MVYTPGPPECSKRCGSTVRLQIGAVIFQVERNCSFEREKQQHEFIAVQSTILDVTTLQCCSVKSQWLNMFLVFFTATVHLCFFSRNLFSFSDTLALTCSFSLTPVPFYFIFLIQRACRLYHSVCFLCFHLGFIWPRREGTSIVSISSWATASTSLPLMLLVSSSWIRFRTQHFTLL